MGLDLWFREDVARILAATHEAMRAVTDATASPGDDESAAYRQGFTDALRSVGIAFGVCLPAPTKPGARGEGRGEQERTAFPAPLPAGGGLKTLFFPAGHQEDRA